VQADGMTYLEILLLFLLLFRAGAHDGRAPEYRLWVLRYECVDGEMFQNQRPRYSILLSALNHARGLNL
jgi:hypothetical protein